MSYHVTKHVLELQGLTPAEKSVLHCLAFYAHEDGTQTWPSMTRIANEAGLSCRQSAQRIVRRMENRGILVAETPKSGGRRNPTVYRFNLEYCNPPDALIEQKPTNSNRGDAGAEKDLHHVKCIPDASESATLNPPNSGKCIPEATKVQPGGCTKGYEPEEREPLERTISDVMSNYDSASRREEPGQAPQLETSAQQEWDRRKRWLNEAGMRAAGVNDPDEWERMKVEARAKVEQGLNTRDNKTIADLHFRNEQVKPQADREAVAATR